MSPVVRVEKDRSSKQLKRVKTGCLTCRSRKIKCDEQPGTCGNCSKMNISCRWQRSDASEGEEGNRSLSPQRYTDSSRSQSSPNLVKPPVRPYRARHRPPPCNMCRSVRSKCTQERPGCARCLSLNIQCKYPTPALTFQSPPEDVGQGSGPQVTLHTDDMYVGNHNPIVPEPEIVAESSAQGSYPRNDSEQTAIRLLLPSTERIEELILAFFTFIAPYEANAFIRKGPFVESVRTGKAPSMLLAAMCAVSAPFVEPPEAPATADTWATAAGRCWWNMKREQGLETVQTALLLNRYYSYTGNFTVGQMWCVLANRQAIGLGYHRQTRNDLSNLNWAVAEERRRLFFACYCIDRRTGNGTPELTFCPANRIKLALPCDDVNFRMGIRADTPQAILEGDESHVLSWPMEEVGLLGYYIRLVGIRYTVKQCHRAMLEDSELGGILAPWESSSMFQCCLRNLAAFRQSIPPRYSLSREAISSRQDSPDLPACIMLHLWLDMCYIELYRTVTPGYPESLDEHINPMLAPAGWMQEAQHASLHHAQSISNIFNLVESSLSSGHALTVADHSLPYVVYSSIRLQMEAAAISPHGGQHLEETFKMMLAYVQRTGRYIPLAGLVVKEVRKMLRRKGYFPTETGPESRAPSPPHLWFRRQRDVDARRDTTSPATSDAIYQDIFSLITAEPGAASWNSFFDMPSFDFMPADNSGPSFGMTVPSGGNMPLWQDKTPHSAAFTQSLPSLVVDPSPPLMDNLYAQHRGNGNTVNTLLPDSSFLNSGFSR